MKPGDEITVLGFAASAGGNLPANHAKAKLFTRPKELTLAGEKRIEVP
jgi:hypothetical protein